jgi:hypothetical protein
MTRAPVSDAEERCGRGNLEFPALSATEQRRLAQMLGTHFASVWRLARRMGLPSAQAEEVANGYGVSLNSLVPGARSDGTQYEDRTYRWPVNGQTEVALQLIVYTSSCYKDIFPGIATIISMAAE